MSALVGADYRIEQLPLWHIRARRFKQHRAGVVSFVVLLALIAFTLGAYPLSAFLGIDASATDLFARFEAPGSTHLLGRDEAGRDVLLRLMIGGQVSLMIGIVATIIGGFMGILIGVISGYFGGAIDKLMMRLTDSMISLPLLPLLIVLGSVDLTKLGVGSEFAASSAVGLIRIIIIISVVDWTTIARVVRASTMQIREYDYVASARASGAKSSYIIINHIIPNITTPIIVTFTITVGRVILLESVLSFLGFGVIPPTPSWGGMLNNAQELISSAPLLAVLPGALIFMTVVAINFLGDGLQHALDPKS